MWRVVVGAVRLELLLLHVVRLVVDGAVVDVEVVLVEEGCVWTD